MDVLSVPSGDEGWLCPACDCKVDCFDLLNEFQGSELNIESTWEVRNNLVTLRDAFLYPEGTVFVGAMVE